MKKVKLFEQWYRYLNEAKFDEFSGKEVSNYIEEITPDDSDIPDYFISKYIKPNDGWKIKDIKLKDLLKDKSFKEYYQSGEERYDEDEMYRDDLYNHLVIYKGTLLDGYSRAARMLRDHDKVASAYVLEGFILESGNAISDSRPFEQEEIQGTIEWVEKNIFPVLGINGLGDDAAILGSAGKKVSGVTSGDIDMALSADKIAGTLGASLSDVIFKFDTALKGLGLSTTMNIGLKQISIGAPIDGNFKNGVGQVDFMLSRDLKWSEFMYHSPDFTKDESKYKGAYRNILLMSIIGKSFFEITKTTEAGEIAEYEAYVIRLNKGVFKVRKSFEGKRGLVKNAKLLKEFDKEITNTPDSLVDLLFNNKKSKDIMTYENLKSLLESPSFKFTNKYDDIIKDFKLKLNKSNMPLPSDL